jgi:hypothetical protein
MLVFHHSSGFNLTTHNVCISRKDFVYICRKQVHDVARGYPSRKATHLNNENLATAQVVASMEDVANDDDK